MIKRFAGAWINFWVNNHVIDIGEKEVYLYGMELLISTCLNFGFMILNSVCIIQMPFAFIPYTIVYVPLRLTAGGYHAKSHWSCVMYTQGIFVLSVLLTKFMAHHAVPFVLPSMVISLFVIWVLAPVEAPNKPLSQSKWKIAKHRSHNLVLLLGLLTIVFVYLNKLHLEFVVIGIAATMSVAVSLMIVKIGKTHR